MLLGALDLDIGILPESLLVLEEKEMDEELKEKSEIFKKHECSGSNDGGDNQQELTDPYNLIIRLDRRNLNNLSGYTYQFFSSSKLYILFHNLKIPL